MKKLAAYSPSAILAKLEDLVDPLEKCITKNSPKDPQPSAPANAAGGAAAAQQAPLPSATDIERGIEQIRSAIGVVAAVCKIEDSQQNRKWQDFVGRLQRKPQTADMLIEALKGDSSSGTI